jgi:nucleotide-binding universal stress UspA family protein
MTGGADVATSEEHFVAVGVDGSPSGDAALDWAAEEARLRGLPVRIVHADRADQADQADPDSAAVGRDLLEAAAARVAGRVPGVTTEVATTSPAEALLAGSRGAALVAVGVRGVHGERHARLGTVATTLVRRAGCPVAVIREPEFTSPGRHVVVAIDPVTGSPGALGFALEEAVLRQLPLVVLAVDARDTLGTRDTGRREPDDDRARAAVESALTACAAHPEVPVTPVVEQARSPALALVGHGRDAALLVVGARRHDDPHLGASVSGAALLHAPCTVAVVRDP